jgi:hypothetical protein
MALFMFWGGEKLEAIFGGKDPKQAPRLRYAGALGLLTRGWPGRCDRPTHHGRPLGQDRSGEGIAFERTRRCRYLLPSC